MNPQWFGDSYDIVKRFFVTILKELGYKIYVDPMLTVDWGGVEKNFYDFVGVNHLPKLLASEKSALLLDPDTGVMERKSRKHASIEMLVSHLQEHEIVFSFDQSFSRNEDPTVQMRHKLDLLNAAGAGGFYNDSHARFLFAALKAQKLETLRLQILASGLPDRRIFVNRI